MKFRLFAKSPDHFPCGSGSFGDEFGADVYSLAELFGKVRGHASLAAQYLGEAAGRHFKQGGEFLLLQVLLAFELNHGWQGSGLGGRRVGKVTHPYLVVLDSKRQLRGRSLQFFVQINALSSQRIELSHGTIVLFQSVIACFLFSSMMGAFIASQT